MDTVSRKIRSAIMARVRSSGNKSTELRLIELLKKEHLSGWRRKFNLQGKPDLVFSNSKVAVFIDGCFWHGCSRCYRRPSSRQIYWDAKIARNMARDKNVSKQLRLKKWRVIRIWEHELKKKPEKIINKLKLLLEIS